MTFLKNYFILVVLFMSSTSIFAQDVQGSKKKIETRNIRASVIEVYSFNDETKPLASFLSKIEIPKRFDVHEVETNYIGGAPLPKNLGNDRLLASAKGLLSKKKKRTQEDIIRDGFFKDKINKYGKPAVALWYSRDAIGNFSTKLLDERALNITTDFDYLESRASAVDRRNMLSELLVPNTFVFVYDVNTLNEIVSKEGKTSYEAEYRVRVYKLKWNKEVQDVFYDEYWSDEKNVNSDNIAKWGNANFEFEFAGEVGGKTSSSGVVSSLFSALQTKNKKEKTKDEKFFDLAKSIKDDGIFKITNKIDVLKTKTTVHTTKPVTAKIGTKEGLFVDQRYYAYEIREDELENQIKKRKGVLRVKQVADTEGIAEGETDASVFTQQGGSKVQEGMLIELKEDWGIIGNAGYTIASNKALGGITLALDYRVSSMFQKLLKTRRIIPGIHFGFELTLNAYEKLKYGGDELDGSTLFFAAKVSKEMYFTNRGNLYIQPHIGIGFSSYSISKENGVAVDKNSKDRSFSAMAIPVGVRLGYNLHPMVNLSVLPEIVKTFQYTRNKQKLINVKEDKQGFGLDKLEGAINFRTTINVRLRF